MFNLTSFIGSIALSAFLFGVGGFFLGINHESKIVAKASQSAYIEGAKAQSQKDNLDQIKAKTDQQKRLSEEQKAATKVVTIYKNRKILVPNSNEICQVPKNAMIKLNDTDIIGTP